MIAALRSAVAGAAATVLPPGIPERAAVPPGWVAAEAVQSRERLAGSIVKLTGGTAFQAFDPATSTLSAQSKKLALSATGDLTVVKELNEAAVGALGIESVIYGILTTDSAAGSEAASLSAAGLPAEVRTVPATGGLQEVQLRVGGGAPQTMSINDMVKAIGREWCAWEGVASGPPPIPAAPGIPDESAAQGTALAAGQIFGEGPARAMRIASLGVMGLTISTCGEATELLCAVGGNPGDGRAMAVAMAADTPGVAAGEGATLTAAREAVALVATAAQAAIDGMDPAAHAHVGQAAGQLRALGVTVGITQMGGLMAQALGLRAVTPAPPPPPAVPPAGPPPSGGGAGGVAAAVAAALGGAAEDGAASEARRRMAVHGASLTAEQLEQAVAQVASSLRASGFAGSSGRVAPEPEAAGGRAASAAAPMLGCLRIAGAEGLTNAAVLDQLAGVLGGTAEGLAAMLTRTVGKPAIDAFFAGDAGHAADTAAQHFHEVMGAATFVQAPATWLDAAHRLRDLVTAYPGPAPAGGSPAADGAGAGAIGQARPGAMEDAVKVAVKAASASAKHSVSNIVIGGLTGSMVTQAEVAASPMECPIAEVARVRGTSYGELALPLIYSDGTVSGAMPAKGAHRRLGSGRG